MVKRKTVIKTVARAPAVVAAAPGGAYAVGIVGVLGVLYLMSREDEGGETYIEKVTEKITEGGETYIEKVTEKITEGVSETFVETVGAVGGGIVGIPEEIVKKTEEKISTDVFGGEQRIHNGEAITYQQFMEKKPIITRTVVAIGGLIPDIPQYGKHLAEETKEYVPGAEERFAELDPLGKVLVGLGQAITVPFVRGGAAGLGAKFEKKFPKTAGFIS